MDKHGSWAVSALYTYPVKSCRGIALCEATVGATGLDHDRLWMLVDARSGRFVTQRQVPRLALIRVAICGDKLELAADAMAAPLHLPLHPDVGRDLGDRATVRVWYDDVVGRCCGPAAAAWLTTFVGRPTRMLYKDPAATRLVSRYLPADGLCDTPPQAGFADVFPFHITTDPSLADVNRRVPRPLTHRHFRPNVVLAPADGCAEPYDEESWTRIEFGDPSGSWSMFVTSRTPRCSMVNVDPETGAASSDGEPMATLHTFRRVDPAKPTFVCFGMQAAPQRTGQAIRVGQRVAVRERGPHALTQPL
ncbi:hypothetical protein IWQ57_004084 [Coemansia nantahalensis]|uniref:Uncharacterized protein n=2 Tax=Coemansia TaxID=4863 RepID=A0ACC1L4K9_9FUNG|nr:hypothetical protein IWQ57_004084 [Coemansia nantahalensis]KAJ2800718.1 hypothetical protein H4R21_003068 [Coemansia helicoidea]